MEILPPVTPAQGLLWLNPAACSRQLSPRAARGLACSNTRVSDGLHHSQRNCLLTGASREMMSFNLSEALRMTQVNAR